MRVVRSLVCLLLSLPASTVGQHVELGAYVARRGETEVSRERYRFDGRRLTTEVELVGRGLVLETQTEVDSTGSALRYHMRVRAGLGGTVLQEVAAQLADSVRWTVSAAGRTQVGAAPIRRPAVVMQSLVFSQLAAALRAYDRVAGGRQTLYAWRPEGGVVQEVGVELRGDSGTADVAGVTVNLALRAGAWVERFDIPAQGLTVTRQDAVAFTPRVVIRADTLRPRGIPEEPYLIEAGGARLIGTLALPAAPGPVPVAVIVPGSGAVDRNGNAPPGLRSNLYAQLAWRLAEQGIASLRYDKRGVGESTRGVDLPRTTFDDFGEDVVAAAAALAKDERFDGVVLVGHSEGGWLATRATLRGALVKGIALLATPGRPFLAILREQLAQQLDSAGLIRFDSAMSSYLRGELPVGLPPYLQPLFRPVNQRFTASIVAYDALAELRRIEVPVLIVQGDRDVQVTPRDAELLATAGRRTRVIVIPGANHVFKAVERADRVAQLAVYADPAAPVVSDLVDALADWIKQAVR